MPRSRQSSLDKPLRQLAKRSKTAERSRRALCMLPRGALQGLQHPGRPCTYQATTSSGRSACASLARPIKGSDAGWGSCLGLLAASQQMLCNFCPSVHMLDA